MPKRAPAKPKLSEEDTRRIKGLEARIAQIRGQPLNRQQTRDLDWLKALDAREAIDTWIDSVPKGEYCRLAGRQHKVVDDCARAYGLPLLGEAINLVDAISALHDFLASNSYKFRAPEGEASLREEKLRQEIRKLEQGNEKLAIDLQFARGQAIDKAILRQALVALSARLRECGQTLARIDPSAVDVFNTFLDQMAYEMESGYLNF